MVLITGPLDWESSALTTSLVAFYSGREIQLDVEEIDLGIFNNCEVLTTTTAIDSANTMPLLVEIPLRQC